MTELWKRRLHSVVFSSEAERREGSETRISIQNQIENNFEEKSKGKAEEYYRVD